MIRRDDYLEKLKKSMFNGMVKVITGIRRSGKSYLLDTIFTEYLLANGYTIGQIIKIDLDSDKNAYLRNPVNLGKHLRSVLPKDKEVFLFIDEIQKCEAINNDAFDLSLFKNDEIIPQITFYDVLNGIMSEFKNVDLYVTGSNSKLLSKDILTDFRGRGWEIRVMPLSFSEFYLAKGGDKSQAWMKYLRYGGMPLVASFDDDTDKSLYLHNLFEETYFKDVIEHNKLSANNKLRELTSVLASSVGSLTNTCKLQNTFCSVEDKNISRATIEKYIECLLDSFLLHSAERYDLKGKKYIGGLKKYYFVDTGLRNACLNFRQYDRGHLMECVIYNELLRRGFDVDVGVIDVFDRNSKGVTERKHFEVDFIANIADERLYIQSAYEIDDNEKLLQESKSLTRINDNFKKIIIEYDNYGIYYDNNGILHLGLFDFLLDRNILAK